MKPAATVASAAAFLAVALALPATAANPYLAPPSSDIVTTTWTGHVWGDDIQTTTQDGIPVTATGYTRRLADMGWGQIVRIRFETPGGHEIPSLYFLVRDEVILELVSGDIEFVIAVVARMTRPPHYDPQDVRARNDGPIHNAPDGSYQSTVETDQATSSYFTTHPAGHYRTMIWKRGAGLIEYSAGAGARREGFRLKRPEFSAAPAAGNNTDIMTAERIGELRIGLSEREVLDRVTSQPLKGANQFLGADGTWQQSWKWPNLGLEIGMGANTETGPKSAASISLNQRGTLRTRRLIGIGSTEAQVREAYKDLINQKESPSGADVVVGSIYGGLIFSIKDGKVNRIFLGAAAE